MKRDYRYFPVLAVFVIAGILDASLENSSIDSYNILKLLVGFFANFIICSGLLHTRNGGFVDYISNVKRINLNVVLVNIISSLATGFFMILSLIPAGLSSDPSDFTVDTSYNSIGIIVTITIVTIILGLIFNYVNFVASDERYLDYSFGKLFKLVVKTGFDLTFETIKIFLKFFIIPVIVLFIILIGARMEILIYGFFNIMGILLVISLVYVVFILPTYMARISDAYMDYSGYEIKDDLKLSEEEIYRDENKIDDSNIEDSDDKEN